MTDIVVLIPHYNDITGLSKSLHSISISEPVDVLIVDDGSKIKPNQNELKHRHKNIHDIIVIYSSPNKGQAVVQNIGLKYILESNKYKYIARLDTGDACYPERFVVQKKFLLNNSEIFLVGSQGLIVDTKGNKLFTSNLPLHHHEIKKRMHINSCFIHSSVMFKIESIKEVGYYPENYFANDDYSFWFKFIKCFATANVDNCLVMYELNLNSISRGKYRKELRARFRILLNYFSFKYFFYSIIGLSKVFIAYLLGVNIATNIAIFIKRLNL